MKTIDEYDKSNIVKFAIIKLNYLNEISYSLALFIK